MKRYILKRILMIFPMLIGISLIMFFVMHLAPGDPSSIRYGLNPEVSEGARAEFNKMYGLDKPVFIQYMDWLKRMSRLDFGTSLIDDRPVLEKIGERIGPTVILQSLSIFLIFFTAITLGVISAARKDSLFDRATTIVVFVGYSMPTFWLALLMIYFFGVRLEWFPIGGMSPWYTEYLGTGARLKDLIWHLVLPVSATAFGGVAALTRYSRGSMIEVLGEPYVLTARAKGLRERDVMLRHVLRNALLPVITIIGLTLPVLISGSFIFETIFSWPGMGRLGYEAVMNYDYPVVMGVGVIATILTLTGIFLSDIMYAVVDPRIRYNKL